MEANMRPKANITGKKIGYVLVLEETDSKVYNNGKKATNKVRQWICLCDCGNKFTANLGKLNGCYSKIVSCGCQNYINHKNRKQDPQETSFKSLFRRTSHNAGLRNIEFKIKYEDFKRISLSDCHYCGSEPSNRYNVYMSKNGNARKGSKEWMSKGWIKTNGIDRLDSSICYKMNNVVPCCRTCNFAKNDLTTKEFLAWIKKIYEKNYG